jgi:hypothetical protein
MSRQLTDDDVGSAVNILTSWHDTITWDTFLEVLSNVLGHGITRQAIHQRHPRIVDAFNNAKARSRENREIRKIKGEVTRHGDVALAYQIQQNKDLQTKIKELKRENDDLMLQFLRWQYNAATRGVTREILDLPLPKRMSSQEVHTMKDRSKKKAKGDG